VNPNEAHPVAESTEGLERVLLELTVRHRPPISHVLKVLWAIDFQQHPAAYSDIKGQLASMLTPGESCLGLDNVRSKCGLKETGD
jgi:hypothetical protein